MISFFVVYVDRNFNILVTVLKWSHAKCDKCLGNKCPRCPIVSILPTCTMQHLGNDIPFYRQALAPNPVHIYIKPKWTTPPFSLCHRTGLPDSSFHFLWLLMSFLSQSSNAVQVPSFAGLLFVLSVDALPRPRTNSV